MSQQTLDNVDHGGAHFSPDGRYRYSLSRRWDKDAPHVVWVMLNPSAADGIKNDATMRRVLRFSADWGFGKLTVVNLYGLVSTDPAELYRAADPVGPDNDRAIARAVVQANAIVVAWGAELPHPQRARDVVSVLRANSAKLPLNCLGLTKERHPRHPVRLAAKTPLEVFYGG
jgi:hypothetical protein